MIRASGTLADPNKLGAVAGFWTVGALVVARRPSGPGHVAIAVAGLVLGITAAWLSGSRTGLAAVGFSVLIAAFEALRWLKLDRPQAGRLPGGGALMIGAVLVVVLQNASTHTIVQRGTLGYLPFFGDRGIVNSANELLWDRFGYGPAAIADDQGTSRSTASASACSTRWSYDFGKVAGYIIPNAGQRTEPGGATSRRARHSRQHSAVGGGASCLADRCSRSRSAIGCRAACCEAC